MKFLLLVAAVFGVVTALPPYLETRFMVAEKQLVRNSVIEQAVLNLLEDLRQTMLTGGDDVPVLDPFEIPNVEVQGEVYGFPGSHAQLSDVTVSKLSTFVVDTLDISLTSVFPQQLYTLTFDGRIPSLEADASEYDLFLGAMGYTVFGKGVLSVALLEPRLSGSVVVRLQLLGGMRLTVQSANLRFQLAGFRSNISGIFNDAAMSAFVNSFLGYFVPNAVIMYETDISGFLNEIIPQVANDILGDIDLGGILPLMAGQPL